ncbi:hypothetical protein JCM14076_03230 [Methylosoma difficile]
MSRAINEEGLKLVKHFEGLYLDAYRCPAGVWTIGYGHTKGVRAGAKITEPEADALLAADLAEAGAQVMQQVKVKLNDNQFAVLASFVFNAGIGSLLASTLLKRLNIGEYQCVPTELAKWVKATNPKTGAKVALPGLVLRRAAEGALWLKTETDDPFLTSKDMPQAIHADEPRAVYLVAAREGLRMRSGAGTQFDVIRVLAKDTHVFVIKEKSGWVAVDLQGDNAIDGWVSMDFLKPM